MIFRAHGFDILHSSRQDMPLTSLDLRGCSQVSDAGLAHLMGMPLTSLCLAKCDKIFSLSPCFQGLPLTSLDLRDCNDVRDFGMAYLRDLPSPAFSWGAAPPSPIMASSFFGSSPSASSTCAAGGST